MAFTVKTWTDRLVEFAGRRKLVDVAKGTEMTVDVTRQEGNVSKAGDAFSAANMNNLESRIKAEFDAVGKSIGGCVLTKEGSGAGTKYYIQTGADAASKKELGRQKRILLYSNKQMSGTWGGFWFDVPSAKSDATLADFGISIRSFVSKNQANVPYTLTYSYDSANKRLHVTSSVEFANASPPYADLYYYDY